MSNTAKLEAESDIFPTENFSTNGKIFKKLNECRMIEMFGLARLTGICFVVPSKRASVCAVNPYLNKGY